MCVFRVTSVRVRECTQCVRPEPVVGHRQRHGYSPTCRVDVRIGPPRLAHLRQLRVGQDQQAKQTLVVKLVAGGGGGREGGIGVGDEKWAERARVRGTALEVGRRLIRELGGK